ncbi:uncharacterized protein LOC106168344 [Lingula anatina]|uniref:Uncharacterized protein LOC106168344 n=1 Tax=Lingula anatina TaxID=7574 RepID=A0A1S3IXS0_LINAN|nr:uncharacterized protein LOC106168344 [Lingula anatina]XP_013402828.1 uncharacterized protein LOC106168344 [Lingula anatina]|eukprot:XP_013402827.1 uncharacterized protein LOC106168344 [Lingula anatina]
MAQSPAGKMMDPFPAMDADQIMAEEIHLNKKTLSLADYKGLLNDVALQLGEKDLEGLKFLMTDFISAGVLQDVVEPRKLFEEMEKRDLLECHHVILLVLCLEQVERKDLVKKIKDFYRNHGIQLQSKDYKMFSKHIFTLFSVSKMLTSGDLNKMKFLLLDEIKERENENIDSPLQLFTAMLKKDIISETDDSRLQQLMKNIDRYDINSKMNKEFSEDYMRLITSSGLEHIMAKLSISPKVDDVDTHRECTPLVPVKLERGDGQPHMLLVSHTQAHPSDSACREDENSLRYPVQAQVSVPSSPVAEDSWNSGTVLEYMSVEKMKEYCSENSLGSGGFGEVFKGSKKYRDKEVAIKVCKKAKKEHELQYVKEKIVGHIRHPFLLPLYAVAATQKEIYLMYPYMEKRDLDYLLKNTSPVPGWRDRCRIIYQVCAGLQYLHTPVKSGGVKIRNSILHMDIKPSNILLDQKLNARIGDHGLATEMKSKQSKVTAIGHGAVSYQDPDFFYSYKNKYRKEYDVFSVGVVMLRLMQAEQDEDEDEEDNKSYIWEKFRNEDGTCCEVKKVTDKAQKDLPRIWPVQPEEMFKCTYKFAELALKCIKKPIADRISLDDLQDSIKEGILNETKIPTFIEGSLCCKCNLNLPALDLHPRIGCTGPGKEEKCRLFCQGCLMDHYRNPLYCPTHGLSQPPIGHDSSYAILVGGLDEDNPDIFQRDVLEFKKVVINPNIMGFRENQVYTVLCDKDSKEVKQEIEEHLNTIKDKTSGLPEVTFVFYYSGHGTQSGLQPLPGNKAFDITKSELQTMLGGVSASEKLVILDCCFAASNRHIEKGTMGSAQTITDVSQSDSLEADGKVVNKMSVIDMGLPDVQSSPESCHIGPINVAGETLYRRAKATIESPLEAKNLETDSDSASPSNGAAINPHHRYIVKGEPSDSDNRCSYQWWSCAEHQTSRASCDGLSIFTKHMVNGLKSGQECGLPDSNNTCSLCEKMQREASVIGYISFTILHSYVYEHVKKELNNCIQQPEIFSTWRRPMKIAYYNKEDLNQKALVFTPKGNLVLKLKDEPQGDGDELSAFKDYIAEQVKEKGLLSVQLHCF